MIPVLNLLQGIDDKLNKNANLVGQYIPNETKITYLNRAQNTLLLRKVGLTNTYQLGLDSFKKRYEDLQFLIVPYIQIPAKQVTGDVWNSYSSVQPDNLLLPIDMYVLATKEKCKDRIITVIEMVKHGDLQIKLRSPHWQPDFIYQETISTMSNDNILTYSDLENTFTINNLFLTYLRYPAYIDIVGYTHLDGTPSATVNCELDEYLENELIDLTVSEIADATANQEVSTLARDRQKTDE